MNMRLIDPADIKCVILHTTASAWGDVPAVTRWHRERGWGTIGYHFLITNCFPTYASLAEGRPDLNSDGVIHPGRSLQYQGAHVRGFNWNSIGIAMVGTGGVFTSKQLNAAISLCADLRADLLASTVFPNIMDVKGHTEYNPGKTCPEVDMDLFRLWVERKRNEAIFSEDR